jgi:starvation-inducible DNA-binding protein
MQKMKTPAPQAKSAPMQTRRSSNGDSDPSALRTPSDLPEKDRAEVAAKINGLVADAYVLYVKTKNFHWHISGPNFRDYHLMLDEQAEQIFNSLDPLAERARKLGQPTLRSLKHILELTSLKENDQPFVSPAQMLNELCADNVTVAKAMREAHTVCDDAEDVATASLLEVYIDETEKRIWFLFESARNADDGGH